MHVAVVVKTENNSDDGYNEGIIDDGTVLNVDGAYTAI